MHRSQKLFTFPYVFKIVAILSLLVFLFYIFISSDNVSSKTFIIVLGGGLTADGLVPGHTQLRLDRAVHHFKRLNYNKQEPIIIPLSGGTTHKPNPTDKRGFPILEASAAAKRLIEMGVPSSSIMEECYSLDTLGNVYLK
jgi:uncharacterized SAM-binding protein YcdF (DUF218 family)